MAVTNPAVLPITVNGTRLDSLAYNIESLTGQRNLPATRNRDVVVPGLHGVVPSRYDDYEAGSFGLRMWVRDVREDGQRFDSDVHPKQQLDRNLDRLFGLFQSGPNLLDVRVATGRDLDTQTMVLRNPRGETSSGTTTAIRTNALMNPSFEASTGSVVLRNNLVSNPGFEVSAQGWAPTAGTVTQTTEHAGGGLAAGKFTTDGTPGTPQLTYVRVGTYTAGQVYTAQALVASDQQDSETPIHLRLVWRDATNTVLQIDDGPDITVPAIGAWTGATVPVFRQAVCSSACPAGATRYEITLVVGPTGTTQPAGDVYYLDNVMVEQAPTAGPYFDGSFGAGYGWAGTAGLSQSTYSVAIPDNWGTATGGQLSQNPGTLVPRLGATHGELLATATIAPTTQFLWSSGTNAQSSLSPSGKWSAAVYVRSDMNPAPIIRLRVAGLDGTGTFLGWATDSTGNAAGSDIRADADWTRYALQGVTLPAGSVACRLALQAVDTLEEGTVIGFECATLEPNPYLSGYFDGDTSGASWGGTAHASFSRRLADTVDWWTSTNGSFIVAADADDYPLPNSYGHGRFTVTASSGDQRVTSPLIQPSRAVRPWQAGAWVWGSGGVTHAQIRVDAYNAGSVLLGTGLGPVTNVQNGWVWVPFAPWVAPLGSTQVRIRVHFYGSAASGPAPVNSTAWVTGMFLATADGLSTSGYTPTGDDYWDARTQGTTFYPATGYVTRPGQFRQAMCKVADALLPQVEGTGTYVARLAVMLSIPSVFWQDGADSDWTYTHTNTNTWTQEIDPLEGATAPIEDAIVIVYGPATNPKVTDPTTGAWVRLNMKVPAGQAWLVDAGRDRSAMGSAGLSPASPSWQSRRQFTDWTSPRSRLLVLHPKYDTYNSRAIVRLTVQGAAKARVVARRKWL